jgi:hypothetical protein
MPRESAVANRRRRRDLSIGGLADRRQLRDAADIEGGKRIADPLSGDDQIGANLGQRQQNKGTLE